MAVDGHDPDLQPLQFDRNNRPLAAIDEAEPQSFIGAEREVRRNAAVDREDRRGVPGIGTGRHRRAIRPQPPILDQKDLVAVNRDRLPFLDDQRPAPERPGLAIAEQAEVTQEGTGVSQWNLDGFPGPRRDRRAGRPAVRRLPAPIPRQVGSTGTGRSFAKLTSRDSPRLNRRSGPASDQMGVCGPPGRSASTSALACNATGTRACAPALDGSTGPRAAAPKPAISSRRFNRKIALAMGPMRTIFERRCPVAAVWPRKARSAIFLLRRRRHML